MDDPYPFPTCDHCGTPIPKQKIPPHVERSPFLAEIWRFEWERNCPSCGAAFDSIATRQCRFCKKWVRPSSAICRYCSQEDPTGDIAMDKRRWEQNEREEEIRQERLIFVKTVLLVLGLALAFIFWGE